VLAGMDNQGNYTVVIRDSYRDVQKFQVSGVGLEFRQSDRFV
jgi:hypothetical protein